MARRALLLLGTLTVLLAGPAVGAHAAVFTVTTTADGGPGSLREAITAANAAPGADRVELPAGTYTLTGAADDDANASGDLDVNDSLELAGAGARSTHIVGPGADRVLHLRSNSGTYLVERVTIRGGRGVEQGAGALTRGTATFRDAAVSGNETGGATINQGGGIYGNGRLVLERVLVRGNRLDPPPLANPAQGGGVFVNGTTGNVFTNVTIDQNSAGGPQAQGGGIYVNGPLRLVHATVILNFAFAQGGGLAAGQPVTLAGSLFRQNSVCTGDAPGCTTPSDSRDCFALAGVAISSEGGNITDSATCGLSEPADRPSFEQSLDPPGDHGGETDTYPLVAGTPAVDFAPAAACPATDQRGFGRPAGAGCDTGAFELGAVPEASPPPATSPPPAPPADPPPAAPPEPAGAPPPPAAPAAPVPTMAPLPKVAALVTFPSTRRCASRRSFSIRLRVPRGSSVVRARVLVNGKRARVLRGARLRSRVDLRGLPKGRFTVRVELTLADGRRVSGTRAYRTCTPKRRSSRGPRV
jgi:hypothetical protein